MTWDFGWDPRVVPSQELPESGGESVEAEVHDDPMTAFDDKPVAFERVISIRDLMAPIRVAINSLDGNSLSNPLDGGSLLATRSGCTQNDTESLLGWIVPLGLAPCRVTAWDSQREFVQDIRLEGPGMALARGMTNKQLRDTVIAGIQDPDEPVDVTSMQAFQVLWERLEDR